MTSLTVLNHEINLVDNLYCLNDLHKASGGLEKHRPAFFLRNQETKDLIAEMENETKVSSANLQNGKNTDVQILPSAVTKIIKGGNDKLTQGTYACKEIVYRYAMWISPKFALAVIRVFDAFISGNLEPKRITLSESQQKTLANAVRYRCQSNKVHYQTVWRAVKEHFDVERYQDILASDFDKAIKFIQAVDLTPLIENKPFEMVDLKITSQVMEYLQALRREVTRLDGNIPKYPQIDDETIVQGIVTRIIQSHRMMLSFDPLNGASVKLVPQNSWLVTEENIADIVGNADGVRKDKLPDIMNALLSRIGLAK